MLRLFFALMPTARDRERLRPLVEGLLPSNAGRTVPAPNWHLTLHFHGAADRSQAEVLCRVLSQAYADDAGSPVPAFPLTLRCGGLGWFRAGRSGVLWLRVQPSAGLVRFHQTLTARLLTAGMIRGAGDRRPLIPHITIARDVPMRLICSLDADDGRSVDICVDRPSLMRSARDAASGRVVYETHFRPEKGRCRSD